MRFGRALAICVLIATPAAAQKLTGEITPFVGYQTGGGVIIGDRTSALEDAPAFGVMLSFDRGRGRKLDFVVAHQTTNALRNDPYTATVKYRTYVDYAQFGGRYIFSPDDRVQPYIALTAGGAVIGANGERAVALAFGYGGGADVRLNDRTALRFDGRFTSTLSATSSTYQCDSSGSCSGFATGTRMTQFTASTGIVVRF